ncbi:MAG: hypothetical protein ACFFG0_49220 [Candidatus Thorarchaeota archaeon]
MTLFDFNSYSEIKESGWSYNTLRPPLKFKDIIIDFKIQWQSYSNNKLRFIKKIKFLVLRIFQRFAYNLGWILSMNNNNKALRRRIL